MTAPSRQRSAVVADDDPEIRDLVTEYLAGRGFKVTQAPDGLEALRCVRVARPDLLVLDLMMPRLGGVQALGHIRRDRDDHRQRDEAGRNRPRGTRSQDRAVAIDREGGGEGPRRRHYQAILAEDGLAALQVVIDAHSRPACRRPRLRVVP
jgi:CheY-like chemotaxis protein